MALLFAALFCLLPSSFISAALIPAPTPTATHLASPSPPQGTLASPAPTLAARCNDGDCHLGGTATTLSASVVTSTILSITSVPCYITSYVTNSQTVYSTVYNTETVTETETKEGVVYVVEYKPTPIVKSSMIKTVVSVTVDVPTYWVESTGTASRETLSTAWNTKGPAPIPTSAVQHQPQQQGSPAWTHVAAVPAAAGATPGGQIQGDGWGAAVSADNGQAGGAVWGNGAGANGAVWRSSGGMTRSVSRWVWAGSVVGALVSTCLL